MIHKVPVSARSGGRDFKAAVASINSRKEFMAKVNSRTNSFDKPQIVTNTVTNFYTTHVPQTTKSRFYGVLSDPIGPQKMKQ